eukprot:TRINITY_DN893_c0_g2_i1.p1 TRINITY_DN893_c0_g2~~TRINITY_DN893_c0_g2_i1.p1  ORF type:complete len:196 (+),score=87.63 TRINITY_DN893_c0_g2_i1:206-793(+)
MPKKSEKKEQLKQPKQPLTAYNLFAQSIRNKLNSTEKLSSKETQKQWKQADKKTQMKFTKEAAKLKIEYQRELAQYLTKKPEEAHKFTTFGGIRSPSSKNKNEKQNEKRSKKDANKKKKPLTAYMLFAQEKRPEVRQNYPQSKVPEQGVILGKMWNSLSIEQKQNYKNIAKNIANQSNSNSITNDTDHSDSDHHQ